MTLDLQTFAFSFLQSVKMMKHIKRSTLPGCRRGLEFCCYSVHWLAGLTATGLLLEPKANVHMTGFDWLTNFVDMAPLHQSGFAMFILPSTCQSSHFLAVVFIEPLSGDTVVTENPLMIHLPKVPRLF